MKIHYSPIIYYLVFLTIVNGSNIFNKDHSTSYPTFDGTVSVSDGKTGEGTMDFTSAATVSVTTTGSGPQVPSTSTQPPSEALLFLTDKTIVQVVNDWIEESNSRNSIEEKYGPIDKWDVSRVTNMVDLFYNHSFDGDISEWDVSQVTDMWSMFEGSSFNGDVSQWDVSQVTDMWGMFSPSTFNGDVSQWNVSRVTDMSYMFEKSPFNGDVSQWDVSQVTDMYSMFEKSPFNGDVSQWDVSQVTDMSYMFAGSSFDQQLCWDISEVTNTDYMFSGSEGCIEYACCVNCNSTLLCD